MGQPDKEIPPPPISKEVSDHYHEIHTLDEEFNEWCKPWKGSLMITVLGTKVNYHILKAKLNRTMEAIFPGKYNSGTKTGCVNMYPRTPY